MLQGIELSEAVKIVTENVNQTKKIETIGIMESLGRISAQDVFAPIDNPPFDRSPLDGYALIAEDTQGATKEMPKVLKVVDKVYAGDSCNTVLESNQAIRIMTGAMIPEGANCVIRQEDTDYGAEVVEIYKPVKAFENYCYHGEDFKKGTKLISEGEKLTFVHLALLASMGFPTMNVYSQPRVAVLVTGEELSPPGIPLTAGKIYNSNLFLIAARLKELSINPIYLQQCSDDIEVVVEKMKQAISTADLVITTGGVSVGEKDIFHDVLPKLGVDRKFWKVNMKPGTPAMFSTYENKPILNLSGNPFAALATFELLARPILAKMSRNPSVLTTETVGTMAIDFTKKSKGKRFIRAIFKDGKVVLPEGGHASGMIASMKDCNCLVEIEPGNAGTQKGDQVKVILL
jgi:molybdopterin molybdotransferase